MDRYDISLLENPQDCRRFLMDTGSMVRGRKQCGNWEMPFQFRWRGLSARVLPLNFLKTRNVKSESDKVVLNK